VTSTMFICWAALAAAWHLYGIPKTTHNDKLFGIFEHRSIQAHHPLLRGGDDIFWAPHSRNGAIEKSFIEAHDELELLADSELAGAYLFASKDNRQFFVLGHAEYDPLCLKNEYLRDLEAGINPSIPENYFPDNDPSQTPIVRWRSHGNLMFTNWLNYFVYQKTHFKRELIGT